MERKEIKMDSESDVRTHRATFSCILKLLFLTMFAGLLSLSFVSREREPFMLLRLAFDPDNLASYH